MIYKALHRKSTIKTTRSPVVAPVILLLLPPVSVARYFVFCLIFRRSLSLFFWPSSIDAFYFFTPFESSNISLKSDDNWWKSN